MVTTTDPFIARLFAQMQDAGLRVQDPNLVIGRIDSEARILWVVNENDDFVQVIILQHKDGGYDLYIQRSGICIEDDVTALRTALLRS